MNSTSSSVPRPGYNLTRFALVLAAIVIMLGAFTRLVDAGLGCPDWPGCYGHLLWPDSDEEVALANQRWPDNPVDHSRTWPEVVHRIAAALLGLMILLSAVVAWRYRGTEGYPFKLGLVLLGMVIVQGLFGMWTVTLKLWPQVVTLHLLGGFTVFALIWLQMLRLNPGLLPPPVAGPVVQLQFERLLKMTVLGLLLVVIQIALGGWVTANYAALACPDLPTCQGQWWPRQDFISGFNFLQQIGPNYLGGQLDNESRVAIHFSHRLGAIVVLCYLTLLGWMLGRQLPQLRKTAIALVAAVWLQLLLGLSNIIFHFPVAIAVLHNAGGLLLLVVTITVLRQLMLLQPSIKGRRDG